MGHFLCECEEKYKINVSNPVCVLWLGGFAIIGMRASYTTDDDNLAQLIPIILEMKRKGEIEIIEDREYENHFANIKGRLFVLQKI